MIRSVHSYEGVLFVRKSVCVCVCVFEEYPFPDKMHDKRIHTYTHTVAHNHSRNPLISYYDNTHTIKARTLNSNYIHK